MSDDPTPLQDPSPPAKRRACMGDDCPCEGFRQTTEGIGQAYTGDVCECGHPLASHLQPAE